MDMPSSESVLPEGEIRAEVIAGKDGWLFLHGGAASQFAYLTGKEKVQAQQVRNMERNTLRRHARAQAVGARYLNVVMPSKPVCCAEKLPDSYAGKCRSLFETYFDQGMNRESRDMTLYPVEAMRGAENFKRIDTHPNDLGNLRAARVILDALGLELRGDPEIADRPSAGDLAVMLGHRDMRSQEPTLLNPLRGLRDFDNICFLRPGTNTGHMRVLFNPADVSGRTLLVCGDSFIVGLLPLFAREFETVLYVRGPVFPYDMVDAFRPSHVLSASTERYISGQIDDGGEASVLDRYRAADWARLSFGPSQALRALMARAARPDIYATWKRHARLRQLFHPLLGAGYPNAMVAKGEDPWGYGASGNDPSFTFPRLGVPAGRGARIRVLLRVAEACKAQIFYSRTDRVSEAFSEAQSCTVALEKGGNDILFTLPPGVAGRKLRLDPVNMAVSFSIDRLDVELA